MIMLEIGDLFCIAIAIVFISFTEANTTATRCPDLGPLAHASIIRQSFDLQKVYYKCSEGYVLNGSPKQVCNKNGEWEPPERPACMPKFTCQDPPHVFNAYFSRVDTAKDMHWKSTPYLPGTKYSVHCMEGFHVQNSPGVTQYVVECSNQGTWVKEGEWTSLPSCVHVDKVHEDQTEHVLVAAKPCADPPVVPYTDSSKIVSYDGVTRIVYRCKSGYSPQNGLPSSISLRCMGGQWTGQKLLCVLDKTSPPANIHRSTLECGSLPSVPHAESKILESYASSEVHYICRSGYVTQNGLSKTKLKCVDGQWRGFVPTCIPIITCPTPRRINGGYWTTLVGEHRNNNKFTVGGTIKYQCYENYKLVGLSSVLECLGDGRWSRIAPSCVDKSEQIVFCQNPGELDNGQCLCSGEYELSYCEPFSAGRWLACSCNSGYILEGEMTITCTRSGTWTKSIPSCRKVSVFGSNSIDDSNSIVDGSVSDKENHMSTLAILIATACSVLGVLLLIMIIVIFRRRKTRPRLYHHLPAPPPYARGSGTYGENDRLAFMAYIESLRNPLPSYEEATRPETGGRRPQATSADQQSPDYRPLPNIPSGVQLNSHSQSQTAADSVSAGNRNSTITMSTINRDGMSEVFGSLDTVNVSVSDASTAVTVDTYDSGTSNRSICSQRATAGSIGSSSGSLANDDAPLLVRNNSPNNEVENDTNSDDDQLKDD